MSRCLLVAELATAHHGDVGLAEAMIAAAAEAGADYVKLQSYTRECINRFDSQYEWLRESWLDEAAHVRLQVCAEQQGALLMSTPFDAKALDMLCKLGIALKIASSESGNGWWRRKRNWVHVLSWPWGKADKRDEDWEEEARYHLTAIPLYPTPLECVGQVPLLDGWSDHCIGTPACEYAVARGAKMVEVHFTIPGARVMPWDKTADDLRKLRAFCEDVCTMTSGVSQKFRERWTA